MGGNTTLTLTLTGATVSAQNNVNIINVVQGDLISLIHTSTGNPPNTVGIVSIEIN